MEPSSYALLVFLVASPLLLARGSAESEFAEEKNSYSDPSPPAFSTTPSTPSYGPPDSVAPSSPPYETPNYSPPYVESPSSPIDPSAPLYASPPSTGIAPSAPPEGYYYGPPVVPSTPDVISPPSDPDISTPSAPDTSTPGFGFPGTGSGSCSFWKDHPDALPDILSFFSTISNIFGGKAASVFGHDLTLKEALSNKRGDGYGSLLREGSAALLNSLVNLNFYYSTSEVRNKFNAALDSNHSAAAQAVEFQNANEGRLYFP